MLRIQQIRLTPRTPRYKCHRFMPLHHTQHEIYMPREACFILYTARMPPSTKERLCKTRTH